MKSKKILIVYFLLILAMMFWGWSFVWYKQAFPYFKPISIILIRLVISIVLLLPYALLRKRIRILRSGHIFFFLLLAFFEPFLYFIGESLGIQFVSPTVASVIISLIPIFTTLTAYFLFKEKIFVKNVIGIFVSFGGVMTVIYFSDNSLQSTWKGVMLLFVAVFSTVGYASFVKKLSSAYNPLSIIIYQNIIGAIYFVPVVWIFEKESILHATWSLQSLLPLLKLSVFASSLAFIFFIDGIRKIGMAKAVVFTNFIPVFAAIFSWLVLNETLHVIQIFGIVLVIGGLTVSQYRITEK